jgi:hypothetical protein
MNTGLQARAHYHTTDAPKTIESRSRDRAIAMMQ